MRAVLALLTLSASFIVGESYGVAYRSSSACDALTSEKTCMTGSADGEACAWCNSAAVGGTCFKSSEAKTLPASVFQCEYQPVKSVTAVECDSITSEKTCMSSSSSIGKCSWCNSAAVGGTCFNEADAKTLPSSVFQCEFQKVTLKATTCDSLTSEKTCMTGTSGTEKCSWCNSAAVGGTCFIESDAKTLPSSVFQCEYQKSKLRATACDSVTSEKTCLTESANGEKCAWCKSAAVGSTCFPESDAHSLPSSVFQCEYQTPASYL